MAILSTSNNQFAQTFTVNQQSGSYILLSTANKYLNKDIQITTNVKQAVSTSDTASADTTLYTTDGSNAGVNIGAVTNVVGTKVTTEPTSGYYVALTVSGSGNSKITTAGWIATGSLGTASTSETQYYPIQAGAYSTSGGGLTANTGYANVTANACYTGGTYDTTDSVSISSQSSDTEGYYKITIEGYGNVKRAAIKKTASTAGYIPVNTSGTQTSAATNKNSNKGYAYLYIKKSTITSNSITPSTSAQTVTISEGYYPSDRTVTIAAMTTGTVTTTYSNSGMSTYFTSQSTSSGASVTITPQYTNTAGYIAAHSSATNNGGIGYWKIKGTSITQGTTTVSGTAPNQTATRGTATWGTGWITSGSIIAASFSNTASSGVTYVDITNTPAAPVLSTSDGYLYINQGYTDNLKIHIGKFISPDVTISATDQILASYTAYDSNGNLLTGTIPSKNASDITRSGKTITIPYGKYEGTVGNHNAVTYNITEGDYSASAANTTAGTITPSVAINNASTYGFTTTQPSGTNGTNYLTIDPGGSVTTKWKSTATATITTAGYIATGNKTATVEGTPTIAAGTNYYVPIITPTFGGGAVTGSSTTAITVTGMSTSSNATSYYIDASSTGSATRGVVTYTNSAGAIAAHNATTALSAPSSATAINSSADRVYIPAAVGAVNMTAGNGSCAYSSANSINITVSDTNTSGIQIGFTGSGQVTGTAAITTAGYAPLTNSFATSNATSSNESTATKYVTGVTLEAPTSGTRYFDITVPNGDGGDTITFRFTVDSSCNVTVAGPD